MMKYIGRKYRLYPTSEQELVMVSWGQTRRAVYNLGLEQRQLAWRYCRKTLWSSDHSKLGWVRFRQRRLKGLERQMARQLAFARKHNGGRYSKRLRKTINKIARLKARQARRRLDFTHKLTTDLAKNHGLVGDEDLQVKAMTASAKGTVEAPGRNVAAKAALNRRILDNIPGERSRQLDLPQEQARGRLGRPRAWYYPR